MTIEFSCECGKTLRLKESLAGKRVKCPKCGKVATVPAATDETATQPSPDRSTKSKGASPRAPHKSSAGLLLGITTTVLAVLLIGAIAVAAWFVVRNNNLAGQLAQANQNTELPTTDVEAWKAKFDQAEAEKRNLKKNVSELTDADQKAQIEIKKLRMQMDGLTKRLADNEKKAPGENPEIITSDPKEPKKNAPAAGDFAFGEMPPPGSWAEYQMNNSVKVPGENDQVIKGMLRQSIGKTRHQGQECFWLETRHEMEKIGEPMVIKVFFQQDEKKRDAPRKILAVVQKNGNGAVQSVDPDSPEFKAASFFTQSILKNAKKVDRPTLELDGIGKIPCVQETGELDRAVLPKELNITKATLWRSTKVPFNLVRHEIKFEPEAGGVKVQAVIHVELRKFGDGATSAIAEEVAIGPAKKPVGGGSGEWDLIFTTADLLLALQMGMSPNGMDKALKKFPKSASITRFSFIIGQPNSVILEGVDGGQTIRSSVDDGPAGKTRNAEFTVTFSTPNLNLALDRGMDAGAFGVLAKKLDELGGKKNPPLMTGFGYVAGKEKNAIIQGTIGGKSFVACAMERAGGGDTKKDGAEPKAKGPRLTELGKPPEGVTITGIYLAGPFMRDKRAKDWPQFFPSGTDETCIVIVLSSIPNGTQLAAEVASASGPVRLASSTVRTIQRAGETIVELTCAPKEGVYSDGDYKTKVLINRVAVAELNWCVGGKELAGKVASISGTAWQSKYGDGSGFEFRFAKDGKLEVVSLPGSNGKASWSPKAGTWQQNGPTFTGSADLGGPRRQRIEIKGRVLGESLGIRIRNESPEGAFGNWYEIPNVKMKQPS